MFAENIAVHAANTPGPTHPRGTVVAPPASSAGGRWRGKRWGPFGALVFAGKSLRPGSPGGVNGTGNCVIAVQPEGAAKGRDAPCSCPSSGRPGCVAWPGIGNHPPLNNSGRTSDRRPTTPAAQRQHRPKMRRPAPLMNNQQRLWSAEYPEYAERGKPRLLTAAACTRGRDRTPVGLLPASGARTVFP